MKTLPIIASTVLAATLAVTPALAADIGINARVSTVCRIETPLSSAPVVQGYNDLGDFTALCNSLQGSRLILAHPEGLANAVAVVDGRRIPLSTGGYTVLTESRHPTYGSHRLALEIGETAGAVSVQVAIEPRGAVY